MSGFDDDKSSEDLRKGWIIRRTDERKGRGVDMKWNGEEMENSERYRKWDNGTRNRNERIIQTVGGNDLFGTRLGGLLSWWDKMAQSGGFRRVPLNRAPH